MTLPGESKFSARVDLPGGTYVRLGPEGGRPDRLCLRWQHDGSLIAAVDLNDNARRVLARALLDEADS